MAFLALDIVAMLLVLIIAVTGTAWSIGARRKALRETTQGKLKALQASGMKNNDNVMMGRQLICHVCRAKVDPSVDLYQLDQLAWIHKKCFDAMSETVERN